MLPSWLGLGTQKGGTTSLHRVLEQHPQVVLPAGKEAHFFSLHYVRGAAWYAEQFQPRPGLAPEALQAGDITPYYLFHPLAPERIRALLPQARLVVLLRDPVARSLSQYFHSRRLGLEPLPLAQALAAEPERLRGAEAQLRAGLGRHLSHQEHSYLARSRYPEQLERYERFFAADQLLLLRSEDWFEQPQQELDRITTFLGLERLPLQCQPAAANAGAGEAAGVDPQLLHQLRSQLEPVYSTMAERYGIRWP